MMNQAVLNQLLELSGFDVARLRTPFPGGFPREDMLALESLVELVVQECLQQVDSVDLDDSPREALGRALAGLAIARHFGV